MKWSEISPLVYVIFVIKCKIYNFASSVHFKYYLCHNDDNETDPAEMNWK